VRDCQNPGLSERTATAKAGLLPPEPRQTIRRSKSSWIRQRGIAGEEEAEEREEECPAHAAQEEALREEEVENGRTEGYKCSASAELGGRCSRDRKICSMLCTAASSHTQRVPQRVLG